MLRTDDRAAMCGTADPETRVQISVRALYFRSNSLLFLRQVDEGGLFNTTRIPGF